jgi:DNA-binding transcriptional LysR family regulator
MDQIKKSQLMYLEAVITMGSIRKAATKLGVRASAVSRQIQMLERATGAILFDRQSAGTVPTPATEHLLEYHRMWSAQLEHLEGQLGSLDDLRSGSVIVAASEGLIPSLTDDVLWDFNRQYPDIRLTIQTKATVEIVHDVQKGIVHIGMAYSPPASEHLRFHAHARHRVVAAMHPDHPLAKQEGDIPFGRAIAYPFATMPALYGLGRLIEAVAAAENLRFTPIMQGNTLDLLKRFALAGRGVAMVTDYSVREELADGRLVARAIDHPMLGNQYAKVFVNSERMLTRAATELLRWIETRMLVFNVPLSAETA